jgi:hypothetical protein
MLYQRVCPVMRVDLEQFVTVSAAAITAATTTAFAKPGGGCCCCCCSISRAATSSPYLPWQLSIFIIIINRIHRHYPFNDFSNPAPPSILLSSFFRLPQGRPEVVVLPLLLQLLQPPNRYYNDISIFSVSIVHYHHHHQRRHRCVVERHLVTFCCHVGG